MLTTTTTLKWKPNILCVCLFEKNMTTTSIRILWINFFNSGWKHFWCNQRNVTASNTLRPLTVPMSGSPFPFVSSSWTSHATFTNLSKNLEENGSSPINLDFPPESNSKMLMWVYLKSFILSGSFTVYSQRSEEYFLSFSSKRRRWGDLHNGVDRLPDMSYSWH